MENFFRIVQAIACSIFFCSNSSSSPLVEMVLILRPSFSSSSIGVCPSIYSNFNPINTVAFHILTLRFSPEWPCEVFFRYSPDLPGPCLQMFFLQSPQLFPLPGFRSSFPMSRLVEYIHIPVSYQERPQPAAELPVIQYRFSRVLLFLLHFVLLYLICYPVDVKTSPRRSGWNKSTLHVELQASQGVLTLESFCPPDPGLIFAFS